MGEAIKKKVLSYQNTSGMATTDERSGNHTNESKLNHG